jgi:hypothetical protein
MTPSDSSFNYQEIKTKMGSIGAPGACQHLTDKTHPHVPPISKVFVASNGRQVDGSNSYIVLRFGTWTYQDTNETHPVREINLVL